MRHRRQTTRPETSGPRPETDPARPLPPRTAAHGGAARQRGFSLVEMLIAMTVLTVVMAGALGVMRSESEALREGVNRLEVIQNLRFGANAVDKDLKTTGAHVPKVQPKLVYADEDVVAFNADFVTNVANAEEAVYYDPDAPNAEVQALVEDDKITVPNGGFQYPDRDYPGGGGTNSPAETLIFFFTPDSSTARADDWALFRQVNDRDPELVSRHLLRAEGSEPFLEYHKIVDPEDDSPSIQEVPSGELPLAHTADTHGAGGDDSAIDSVRAVRLRMAATNGKTGDEEEVRTVSRMIRIPNMGVEKKRVCGSTPVVVGSLTPNPDASSGASTIKLEWSASDDQESGEEDVVRYLVWKRKATETDWGPPMVALPVTEGETSYSYRDAQVTPNENYDYAVAAQDCTPNISPKTTVGPVEAPEP